MVSLREESRRRRRSSAVSFKSLNKIPGDGNKPGIKSRANILTGTNHSVKCYCTLRARLLYT